MSDAWQPPGGARRPIMAWTPELPDAPDALAESIARRLEGWSRRKVPLDTLARMLVEARPELATTAERGARLDSLAVALAAPGKFRPSALRVGYLGRSLPAFLLLEREVSRVSPDPSRSYPFVPELAFAARTRGRWPAATFSHLVELNTWLARRPAGDIPAVPVRERSLEIFGDDKLLERLLEGVLARPGPHHERLGIYFVPVPMLIEQVPQVPTGADRGRGRSGVLVVENATSYDSLLRAGVEQAGLDGERPGFFGYGAGAAAERSIVSLASSVASRFGGVSVGGIWYFGDLDREGLEIAARTAQAARSAGLPPVRPHERLYDLLLTCGRPQARRSGFEWPRAGLDWLGERLSRRVVGALGSQAWLAQEWVGIEALRKDTEALRVD